MRHLRKATPINQLIEEEMESRVEVGEEGKSQGGIAALTLRNMFARSLAVSTEAIGCGSFFEFIQSGS